MTSMKHNGRSGSVYARRVLQVASQNDKPSAWQQQVIKALTLVRAPKLLELIHDQRLTVLAIPPASIGPSLSKVLTASGVRVTVSLEKSALHMVFQKLEL